MLPLLPDFRVRQRDYLLEIIRALTQQLDLEVVLARILEAATDMLGGLAGLIALRDESSGAFRVEIQHRVTTEFVRHFDSILRDIPDQGDPSIFMINEIERRLVTIGQTFDLAGTVGLPLQLGDELLGVLLVFRAFTTPFTSNERQILQTFTDQAAIAVNNARLYQQTLNERRRVDAILEGSADGIAIMDATHTIQRWNRALAKLTNITALEAIGDNHDNLIKWAKREPGTDLIEAEANGWGISSISPLYVEGDLLKKDGRAVAVGITYAPIFDGENRLVNIVASVRDITKFREAEQL
ncbi:MAG: PAS domain S-box protein, partial [Chloroflexota bacterium]